MSLVKRLTELGITFPDVPHPAGAYVPTVETGKLVFVSGQLPIHEGKLVYTRKVGEQGHLSVEEGAKAARLCAINALAALNAALGGLDAIKRIVKVEVFVNSAAGFTDQALVANGASELLQELFGQAGQHTRAAVGVAELPLDAAVEVCLIVERI
jgi:enamine deaminase RidA (YjgF/YER057c/UK114 family)